MGIASPQVRFAIPQSQNDAQWAEGTICRAGMGGGFGVVNPGAGWPSKLWPTDRYAALAEYLGRELRLPTFVVWAGAQERTWAEWIVAGSGGYARLAPPTSLRQLAALVRKARLFIGSDTGPLHLAAAVGVPCVGLYGPMPAARNGPYGPQHIALQKAAFDGTSRQRRNAPASLMEAIQVEDVCQSCARILRHEVPARPWRATPAERTALGR